MPVIERQTIEADIAETSAAIERLRAELATMPLHLRGSSRLFLGQAEERQRLMRRLAALRQLAQASA